MNEVIKYPHLMLQLAEHDLIAMNKLATPDVPEDVFGFHCQQAIEKSFKALIAFYDKPFPLTHDLEDLYELLTELNPVTKKFDELVFFTPFSVQIRYGEVGFEDPLDRGKALKDISELINFTKKLVTSKNA